ncbi:MAG: HAMP domain-containing protein [Anaerolineales bacterium]|nr:HAMP domain-containing protein [Anaerolineales bacterium]
MTTPQEATPPAEEASYSAQPFQSQTRTLRPRFYGLRGKLIVPYVLLTLLLAMVGIFVVTRLVADSLRERFANQLYEASRIVADGFVRQEQIHLDNLYNMALSQGVIDAFNTQDEEMLRNQLEGIAAIYHIQVVSAVDTTGLELFSLGLDPVTGEYIQSQGVDFSGIPFVSNVLAGYQDNLGDKFTGLLETKSSMVLVTSAPVYAQDSSLLGVLLVGTRLDSILASAKTQALADIVLLDSDLQLLGTTLPALEEGYDALEEAAVLFSQQAVTDPQEVTLYGRAYEIFCAPFIVREQNLGWLGVVLPGTYVTTPEATSRSTFSILFALATAATIIVGFLLAQNIARPILRLRTMTQAVASGDLDQSIRLRQSDEIGDLASAFDQMTEQLRERTSETERLYAETVQRNKELADINARLQQTQLQLIQSEKLAAIGQLTAGIVHDVKNPLAVIKGMAEVIGDEESLSEETRQGIRLMHESAVKANNIVTDLLKFARQTKPEMKVQDLRETIEAALRLTAYMIREAKIRVNTSLPNHSIMLNYDSQQIEQVFINLITNAVQAMPSEGVLNISVLQGDHRVGVVFRDTGIGIPVELLNRIFDPFFTTKREGEGTGLGLSVSYGIVASHHGYIGVESVVGQGSTFTVYLPFEELDLPTGEITDGQ